MLRVKWHAGLQAGWKDCRIKPSRRRCGGRKVAQRIVDGGRYRIMWGGSVTIVSQKSSMDLTMVVN